MQYGICNSRFFETFSRPEKIKAYYGGGGSGKSMSLCQHMVMGLCSGDGLRRAIFRKTYASMRSTTYNVIKDVLNDWGVPYSEDKTHHIFSVYTKNGEMYKYNGPDEAWDGEINTLAYLGLDDPEKIKGAEFIEVWLEEVTDFKEDDYKQLRIRLSRTRDDVIMYMSFNPIDAHHWVIKKVVNKATEDNNIFVHHSTYLDNIRNLSQTFVDELEGLAEIDENFYRVYTLGLPGVLKGQIYNNWKFEDPALWPAGYKSGMHWYSLDFGYNAPMPVAETWYYGGEYYIKERLYERGMTTSDLIAWLKKAGIAKSEDFYCDSAEPDRIEEMYRAGYNAKPSKKDVKAGIDFVKGCKIHVDATCSPNIYKEYNNYKWKEDKEGNSLDEPVKAFDHMCFIAGTMITTLRGDVPIEYIKMDDLILTRKGYMPIREHGVTSESAEVCTLECNDGTTLTGTPDHPIWADCKGWVPLESMRFLQVNTQMRNNAPEVVHIKKHEKPNRVYNLSVSGCPEYYANGILVHNCDAIRYGIYTAPTEPVQAVSKVQIQRPSFGGFASSRPTF